MWKNNRPDGWMNPYLQKNEQGDFVDSRVFEAGADAMLEALVKNGWLKEYNKVDGEPEEG